MDTNEIVKNQRVLKISGTIKPQVDKIKREYPGMAVIGDLILSPIMYDEKPIGMISDYNRETGEYKGFIYGTSLNVALVDNNFVLNSIQIE